MKRGWEDFKKHFPWQEMTIGFLIPKAIFFIGIGWNMLYPSAVVATGWCLAVFWVSYMRHRAVNIFAVLAVIVIVVRIVVVLASKSPVLYMYAQALDSASYGVAFLGSLFFPRSLIQLFAEASSVTIPEAVRGSVYYVKGWRIVTSVWGMVYMILAVLLVLLRSVSMKAAALIDIIASWPTLVVLIAFTVLFPRWYWSRTVAGASAALGR